MNTTTRYRIEANAATNRFVEAARPRTEKIVIYTYRGSVERGTGRGSYRRYDGFSATASAPSSRIASKE